jgi:DNA-binding phage protein
MSDDLELIKQASRLLNQTNLAPAYLANKSGLSPSTIRRLKKFGGEPYRPQLKTIEFALRALGMKLTIVGKDK